MGKGLMTRQKIVDRALALAGEVGLESISLGVLAEHLSLSKSGLFAHFRSKEALQMAVLQEAKDEFTKSVVVPAIAKPRGEPRVQAIFTYYCSWIRSGGRCIFMALAQEYDDRTGPVHALVVEAQKDLNKVFEKAARIAIEEGHFHSSCDPAQFAFEFFGIAMAYQHTLKLLDDPKTETRAQVAFDALIARQKK
jgi:AcrR family transcriptional regulator